MPHVGPVLEGRTFFCPHCGALYSATPSLVPKSERANHIGRCLSRANLLQHQARNCSWPCLSKHTFNGDTRLWQTTATLMWKAFGGERSPTHESRNRCGLGRIERIEAGHHGRIGGKCLGMV